MKNIWSKTPSFWILSGLAYLVCLLLVALGICFYPLFQQKTQMERMLQSAANSFNRDNAHIHTDMDVIFIYNSNSEIKFQHVPKLVWCQQIPENITEDIKNLNLRGKNAFRFYYESFENDLIAAEGISFFTNDGQPASAIMVRNVKNVPESVEGALVIVTAAYWIIVILLWILRKKRLKYEELERNYIANVTHSLKAPIASVRALTEALIDVVPADSDKQQPYFGRILKETAQQDHSVQEILELSKLQSRKTDFSKTRISAAEVFKPCIKKYSEYCSLADIPFSVTPDLNKIPDLYTNASRVNTIMNTLLENAVKYVDDGKIIISFKTERRRVIVSVINTCGCICPEDLPLVFNRFFVGKNSITGSSGLGLSIAKGTAEGLHEKIRIESSPENGTTVSFTLKTS